jgi:hypothetical protein
LQPTFADKMPGIFIRLEMSGYVGITWEGLTPELLRSADMTENRVAHFGCCRREIRFIECATQKRSCGHDDLLRPDVFLHGKKHEWANQKEEITSHSRLLIEGQAAEAIWFRWDELEHEEGTAVLNPTN